MGPSDQVAIVRSVLALVTVNSCRAAVWTESARKTSDRYEESAPALGARPAHKFPAAKVSPVDD